MLLAEFITFETILPYAVFGLFAVITFWVLDRVAGRPQRSLERIEELRNPMARRRREEGGGGGTKKEEVTRVLAAATTSLAKPLQPKSEYEMNQLKQKLAQAGFRTEGSSALFLGMKFAGLVGGLFLSGIGFLAFSEMDKKAWTYAAIIGGGLFYAPDLILRLISGGRKQQIFLGLPDALDLLVVCVEAGLGLDQAMRKVTEEMKKSQPVIAEEFGLANLQIQMGRPRAEVLHELGVRTGVDDLRTLTGIMIQAEKFGTSVAQALRVQSDSMRTRRRQLAEEKAAKTAVKLLFPLVLFIFPGIFVVLVGPAAITMIREMFPMMEKR